MTFTEEVVPNFCLPLDLDKLQNDRVQLVPLEHSFDKFTSTYVSETSKIPDTFKYVRFGPFASPKEFQDWYKETQGAPVSNQWFAIVLSKCTIRRRVIRNQVQQNEGDNILFEEFEVPEGTMAGTTALVDAEMAHSVAEIGHVMIFPRFQRTFVATQAHGLMIRYLLDPAPAGLHFRRVQWHANSLNLASIKAAERLGFISEGITRWHRVLPEGKLGVDSDRTKEKVQNGVPSFNVEGKKIGPARHTVMLSLCWDDWLDGGRDKINALMARN